MLSKNRIVPVLVDQFNDIIEWKAQILQEELERQNQKCPTSENCDRRFSHSDLDLFASLQKSYSTADCVSSLTSTLEPKEQCAKNKTTGLKLKRSKSQKCFARKFNRIRIKAIRDTINEQGELDISDRESPNVKHSSIDLLADCLSRTQMLEEKPNKATDDQYCENIPIKAVPDTELFNCAENLNENDMKIEPKVEKIDLEEKKVEASKPLQMFNILLEKLSNIYRHNFVVKTSVTGGGYPPKSGTNCIGQCVCGEVFTFSDKHLQCISCLTKCHTNCASSIPKPCIKYVDPFLKPSKLISNYVYPRTRPSIPALIINCCREIEIKCHSQHRSKSTPGMTLSSFKLYYVESERLKLVKDECKRLLQQAKMGYQRLDHLNMDHLCGMVKYFLADVCESLFTQAHWKEYAINIHKRSESELKQSLLDTFDQMNQTNVHTLCFMLLHLKHLIKQGYQDMDILIDIFCPILMGDIEVRRKTRLMKVMLQVEDNVLLSFVES